MNLADGTHDGVPSGILSSVELYLGIIGACLPLIPPAFLQMGTTLQHSYIGNLISRKASKDSIAGKKSNEIVEEPKEPDYNKVELGKWPSGE